ncbi:MAG: 16S rRNA (guanine(966)-N(2))-methyltransferase RsmD [Deltaproteobacteria bacterium]|jgi:16S rRNA (guanine966-N2)-methyltransferase|nr:16S rRNA (guanine(966)-N(2))-methyltransferase RsmD [Deltaproteobacteria bacterium]
MPLRIFSGERKGLKLHLPPNPSFKPTQAKVREAIFSVLGGFEVGKKALDLYAGSGAMGLEAFSRGALSALFVDDSPEAVNILGKNLALFSAKENELKVLKLKLPEGLSRLKSFSPFDLVFMDPPYRLELSPGENLKKLIELKLLNPGSLLTWEMDAKCLPGVDPNLYPGFPLFKTKTWGSKGAAFFVREP